MPADSPDKSSSPWRKILGWSAIVIVGCGIAVGGYWYSSRRPAKPSESTPTAAGARSERELAAGPLIRLSKAQQAAIGLEVVKAVAGTTTEVIRAPGQVAPDETKFALIPSRAPGVVRTVTAQIGQDVRAGDLLATLDSPTVAQARADLIMSNLKLEYETTRADWQSRITEATLALIEDVRTGHSLQDIQERFEGRPVGQNREALLSAVAKFNLARASVDRSRELLTSNAVSEKQFQVVEAEYEAALALYRSLMDRMGTETRLTNTSAQQERKQAEADVRVARGRLRALGVSTTIDPFLDASDSPVQPEPEASPSSFSSRSSLATTPTDAPTMGRYELRAPFAGTIFDRDMIVPGVPIVEGRPIFHLADLSTVWVEAKVHEGDFAALEATRGGSVQIRSPAYPDQVFPGRVLYTGDLVDQKTRAIKLLAHADNTEDRKLKPGMFVDIEIRGTVGKKAVMVPASAILSSGKAAIVYVRTGDEVFERREVLEGAREDGHAALFSGVEAGEEVVTAGGFKLKAEEIRISGSAE